MNKNIFVIGMNDFNLQKLKTIINAENYSFHGLLNNDEVETQESYRLEELIDKAKSQLNSFSGSIDAIVGYIDFPVNSMVPILCREFGLRSATLDSVLKCEHKYWSRVEQNRCVHEFIPHFNVFDPFDDDALSRVELRYPFWIKPIKSFASYLGFRINNKKEFWKNLMTIRANIGRVSGPFDYLLTQTELPPEIFGIGANYCIAEEIIGGRQCTLEGYVFEGDVQVYGIVDSIRLPNRSTFSRYQYPSQLPKHIRQQMIEVTQRLLTQIEFDNSAFNIEFFWNENRNKLWLLEVNPRISQEHCPIFECVHGASNHEIIVDVALGTKPTLTERRGEFKCAAKFFLRKDGDAMVKSIPTEREIQDICNEIPGTSIMIIPKAGARLSELRYQESYSYCCAIIFMGAQSQQELLKNYQKCKDHLHFEFADELY